MRLYETRARQVVPFRPASRTVRMYVCGITPYDATHVGQAATFVAYDVLARRLIDLGMTPKVVRNITDVDDDLLGRAAAASVHYLDLAAATLREFNDDLAALGLLKAHSEPRATSAIADIRKLIGRLLASGHAYQAKASGGDGGSVFFDASTAPTFGQMAGWPGGKPPAANPAGTSRQREEVTAVASAHVTEGKRNATDFVLWQAAQRGEPSWGSRWGAGRPGWHVECSALALRELGETIDLHGGGRDLIYPHHECSQAQTEAATGKPFVGHWMHAGTVGRDGQKMSKSAGNLTFVGDVRRRWGPMALRLALLSAHYRGDWDWTDGHLVAAADRLATWRSAGSGDGGLAAVRERLDDDLDTPGALAAIDQAAAGGEGVTQAAGLLGVTLN